MIEGLDLRVLLGGIRLMPAMGKIIFPLGNIMRDEPLLTAHRIGGCLVESTAGDDHFQTFV